MHFGFSMSSSQLWRLLKPFSFLFILCVWGSQHDLESWFSPALWQQSRFYCWVAWFGLAGKLLADSSFLPWVCGVADVSYYIWPWIFLMWILRIKLRSLGLESRRFSPWTVSPASLFCLGSCKWNPNISHVCESSATLLALHRCLFYFVFI